MSRRSYMYEDRKNAIAYVITAILVVLTVICGFVIHHLSTRSGGTEGAPISVSVNGTAVDSETELPIDDMTLSPGGQAQYTVAIATLASGKFEISLKFTRENTFTRNVSFVSVSVLDGETVLAEKDLQSALAGNNISFTQTFEANVAKNYTVRYSIPASVGNEAQNLDLRFDVELIAQKK